MPVDVLERVEKLATDEHLAPGRAAVATADLGWGLEYLGWLLISKTSLARHVALLKGHANDAPRHGPDHLPLPEQQALAIIEHGPDALRDQTLFPRGAGAELAQLLLTASALSELADQIDGILPEYWIGRMTDNAEAYAAEAGIVADAGIRQPTKTTLPPEGGSWSIGRALTSRWTFGLVGALAASLSFLLTAPPGRDSRGSRSAGYAASASLWPGQEPGNLDEVSTDRRADLQRLLIVSATRFDRVWVARVNGPEGVRPLKGGKWLPVGELVPRALPLDAPHADAQAEWFVAVYAPKSANHGEIARAALALLTERLPAFLAANTQEARKDLAKAIGVRLTQTANREIHVEVCRWKVVD